MRVAELAKTVDVAVTPILPTAKFGVGQVFRHRQFGYRYGSVGHAQHVVYACPPSPNLPPPPPHFFCVCSAVIIAADESCRASAGWITATGTSRLAHGTSQPFYTCLVDIRDRPAAQVSYVAEENIALLFTPPQELGSSESLPTVLHPLIQKHFVAYDRGLFVADDGSKSMAV